MKSQIHFTPKSTFISPDRISCWENRFGEESFRFQESHQITPVLMFWTKSRRFGSKEIKIYEQSINRIPLSHLVCWKLFDPQYVSVVLGWRKCTRNASRGTWCCCVRSWPRNRFTLNSWKMESSVTSQCNTSRYGSENTRTSLWVSWPPPQYMMTLNVFSKILGSEETTCKPQRVGFFFQPFVERVKCWWKTKFFCFVAGKNCAVWAKPTALFWSAEKGTRRLWKIREVSFQVKPWLHRGKAVGVRAQLP